MAIAGLTFFLVVKYDFSIWYGGGFGMFASLDGSSTRYLTISANTGKAEYNLDLSNITFSKYENNIRKIIIFPKKSMIESLLKSLCIEQNYSGMSLVAKLSKMNYNPLTQSVSTFVAREVHFACS